ncbi:MAG: ribosomal protein S18-alanine N-acetyltransferase [Gammaproteobacteria bacterium]|nr:ribosomal protein S18-alanine N-acetyltransferase [Gammaproteobacteria bacterium]
MMESGVVKFRPMEFRDLPMVMMVEERAYPHPWTEGIFKSCLKVKYPAWIMIMDGNIVGYGLAMIQVGECHILNITIDPDYQGQGLGRRLLRHFLEVGIDQQAQTAFLEVRVSNEKAINLYESEGFHRIGLRQGYYRDTDGREDAVVMARQLILPGTE